MPYPPNLTIAAEKAARDAKRARKREKQAAKRAAAKPNCQCHNHRGGSKVPHKTHEAALTWALARQHLGVTFTIYQCPTSDRYHVKTASAASRIKRVPA